MKTAAAKKKTLMSLKENLGIFPLKRFQMSRQNAGTICVKNVSKAPDQRCLTMNTFGSGKSSEKKNLLIPR